MKIMYCAGRLSRANKRQWEACDWQYPNDATDTVMKPECPKCGGPLHFVQTENDSAEEMERLRVFCDERGLEIPIGAKRNT